MSASVMCISCEFGACDRCQVGYTPFGIIGGWLCPCKHDPDEAKARAQKVREDAARMFAPNPGGDA